MIIGGRARASVFARRSSNGLGREHPNVAEAQIRDGMQKRPSNKLALSNADKVVPRGVVVAIILVELRRLPMPPSG